MRGLWILHWVFCGWRPRTGCVFQSKLLTVNGFKDVDAFQRNCAIKCIAEGLDLATACCVNNG